MTIKKHQALIPVSLLTGFLGSGKTTVLNHLVCQPELADALVIINEFGEMALDHDLVAHSTENIVMEMSSGCLCCTIRGDLVNTLHEIAIRISTHQCKPFKRVLIETTGLADPAPIINTLMNHPQMATRYRLDGIVTIVDLASAMDTLDRFHEAIKQIAVADTLLLSKADQVSDEQQLRLLQRLDGINPAAPRWPVEHGNIAPDKVLKLGLFNADGKAPDVARWLKEEAYTAHNEQHQHEHRQHEHHHHDVNRHDDHIHAFCFTMNKPIPEWVFSEFLELLKTFMGENILRVKGILNLEGSQQPFVLHGVQHMFYPPVPLPNWPSEDRRSRLVFITRDVSREKIEQIFKVLLSETE